MPLFLTPYALWSSNGTEFEYNSNSLGVKKAHRAFFLTSLHFSHHQSISVKANAFCFIPYFDKVQILPVADMPLWK